MPFPVHLVAELKIEAIQREFLQEHTFHLILLQGDLRNSSALIDILHKERNQVQENTCAQFCFEGGL